MKLFKKVSLLLCIISLALAMTACGNDKGAAEILAEADKKVQEADSMQATMVMDMEIEVAEQEGEGLTLPVQTSTDMVIFNNPSKMKMITTMAMMGAEETMEVYVVETDGTYAIITNETGEYEKETLDLSAYEEEMKQASFDLYLKNPDSFSEVGKETVNDVEATKYEGVISGDAMEELIAGTGMKEIVDSMGSDDIDFAEIFSDMKDIGITVWVDGEGYPARYEMDMAEWMNALYAKLPESMMEGVTINCKKVLVSIDCFNYNQAEDFEVPTV